MWIACAATSGRVYSRSMLPPRAMFRSVVLLQLGAVFMSVATTESCENVCGSRCHLKAMMMSLAWAVAEDYTGVCGLCNNKGPC